MIHLHLSASISDRTTAKNAEPEVKGIAAVPFIGQMSGVMKLTAHSVSSINGSSTVEWFESANRISNEQPSTLSQRSSSIRCWPLAYSNRIPPNQGCLPTGLTKGRWQTAFAMTTVASEERRLTPYDSIPIGSRLSVLLLNVFPTPAYTHPASSSKSDSLDAMSQNAVTTKEHLLDHMFKLLDEADAIEWPSGTPYAFIQHMAESLDQAHAKGINTSQPSWDLFARMLEAGRGYSR